MELHNIDTNTPLKEIVSIVAHDLNAKAIVPVFIKGIRNISANAGGLGSTMDMVPNGYHMFVGYFINGTGNNISPNVDNSQNRDFKAVSFRHNGTDMEANFAPDEIAVFASAQPTGYNAGKLTFIGYRLTY